MGARQARGGRRAPPENETASATIGGCSPSSRRRPRPGPSAASMDSAGMTPDEVYTDLSTVVRVVPTRARAY
ncbi:hypothetical protein CLV63_104134 [Murinocardiopsis flavida]|uniref:Uncharacterized protein n=1 Tax=Murinocardiopsis flavida TaxID=645275 RepID=A0A2P8DNW5_9ACTN|nr:hypothetical protein CLV63_104134 [Murinocardiopsis flavida]